MNQFLAVAKALRSIYNVSQIKLCESDWIVIYEHLKQMYAIGFDEGRKQTSHGKPVMQFKNNKFIQEFSDITSAAKSIKVHKSSICKAIKENRNCKGYFFKIKNPRFNS